VLAGGLSVQFGAAFGVILIASLGPLGAVTLRLVVAALLVAALARPRLGGHSRRDVAVIVGFGLVLAAMNICFYQAAARLPLGAAVTLEFLGPLGLAILTSRRFRDLLWVGLAGVGVVLLTEGGFERLEPVGVVFAVGAGVCWAAYILLGAQAGRRFPGAAGLALALAVAGIAVAPVGVASAGPALVLPYHLLLGATVALLCSALPWTLEIVALRQLPARTFGVLMSLQPAIGTVAGFVVLDQRLTTWQLAAVGLVVVASAGATVSARAPGPR
jgi:inner membrane transporter RhtA